MYVIALCLHNRVVSKFESEMKTILLGKNFIPISIYVLKNVLHIIAKHEGKLQGIYECDITRYLFSLLRQIIIIIINVEFLLLQSHYSTIKTKHNLFLHSS